MPAPARGDAPGLIEAIAGEPIAGNWSVHPNANAIYNVLAEISGSDQVLVCRLLKGKISLVRRWLWPALVRLAERFKPEQIAQIREEHTAIGRHVSHQIPYPQWVPPEVA